MRSNKIIYSLNISDIQNVAEEYLERRLNDEELKKVIDRVGDYIPWYDAIENTIIELRFKSADEREQE
ncbi:MAG TPA: hypothetical protein PKE38_15050 [Ignavibacteriaceae bacterium]|jgi:hypothetical protein|nr:hypothetical protein [Ignavibacteriaceae bacterium]